MLKNSQPDGVLEKMIIKQLYRPKGVDKMNALLASSYIFRSDFTDVLIDVEKNGNLTEEENQYLHKMLVVISSRPYITEIQKAQLEKILKSNR